MPEEIDQKKKMFVKTDVKEFTACFLPGIFMALGLASKSLIHFKFTFVYGVKN